MVKTFKSVEDSMHCPHCESYNVDFLNNAWECEDCEGLFFAYSTFSDHVTLETLDEEFLDHLK